MCAAGIRSLGVCLKKKWMCFLAHPPFSLFLLFLEPRSVHQIAVGNLLVQLLALFDGNLLDELGGDTGPEGAGLDDRAAQHQGAGSHDGAFAHHGIVEHGGSHADEGTVLDGGSMDGDVVAHRYVVADFDHRTLVEGVEDAAVLNVHTVADADGVHIAPKDGVEPDATVAADGDIAYDGGVFGQVGILADLRGEPSD